MDAIHGVSKHQHGDHTLLGIHNPIFGNTGFGVFTPFCFIVAPGVIGADDFNGKIGAKRIAFGLRHAFV